MSNTAKVFPLISKSTYFGLAEVRETTEDDGSVYLRLVDLSGQPVVRARLAIPNDQELVSGDEALVAGEDLENLYVIGLLTQKRTPTITSKRLTLANGACAAIEGSPESQILRIFSKRKELLFEYDPNAEKARVTIESGDIEFATRDGNIKFDAAGTLQLDGQKIEMASRSAIQLAVKDAIGLARSAFSLGLHKMKFSSPKLGITTPLGEFNLKETRYTGKKFYGKIAYTQLLLGKLETVAKSIFEKAKNVYKTVEQLSQLKTGRMRTLVDSTYYIKTKKSVLKSEEDFKVKANKIHLG